MPTTDYAPTCGLPAPGSLPHGPGWYLVAANEVVEAGPFATADEAHAAAGWLDEQGLGVNPYPWEPVFSLRGVVVGARRRVGRNQQRAQAVSC